MFRKKNLKLIVSALVFSSVTANIIAQTATDTTDTKTKKVTYTAGLGVGFGPQYEGSDDVLVIPGITFNVNWQAGQYIRLSGLGIEGNILSSKQWEFGPKINFRIPRDDNFVDNSQVSALEELDFSLLAGFFTRYKFGNGFDAKAEYTHDISGVSDGGVANLELGYTFTRQKYFIRLAMSSSLATKNYMETYFGINDQNRGNSSLTDYSINGGIKGIGFQITPTYIFNSRWMLGTSVGFRQLLGNVADSPIVRAGSESQFLGGISIIHIF